MTEHSPQYQQAISHYKKSEFEQAEMLCRQLLSEEGETAKVVHLLGIIEQQKGNLALAIEWIQKAIQIQPQAHFYNNLGNTFLQQQDFISANQAYQSAIQLKPDFVDAYANSGRLYLIQGHWSQAIQALLKAIQLKPDFAVGYINLGMAYHKSGDFNQAEGAYQKALDLQADLTMARDYLKQLQLEKQFFSGLSQGRLAFESGQLEKAEQLLTQCIQFIPQAPDPYFLLAQIYHQQKEYQKVLAIYQQALQYQPNHPDFLEGIGMTYQVLKQEEQAIQFYQKVLSVNPHKDNSYYCLAFIFYEKNQIQTAIEHCLDCLTLNPEHLPCRQVLINCFNHPLLPEQIMQLLIHKHQQLETVLTTFFESSSLNVQSIFSIALNYLSLKEPFDYLLSNAHVLNYEAIKLKFQEPHFLEQMNHPLFIHLINQCVNHSLELEKILTYLRRFLLEQVKVSHLQSTHFELVCALANQGFNTEYVFKMEMGEVESLKSLKQNILEAITHELTEELQWQLVVYAMYSPLSSLRDRLKGFVNSDVDCRAEFKAILTSQLMDYLIEEELKEQIESLTPIQHQTSQQVKEQYEENPYPRWLSISSHEHLNMYDFLYDKFPYYPLSENLKRPLNVLVAGCGTGQQPISLTKLLNNVEDILALDLSQTSLAYAMRKAKELSIHNIVFKQADILELGNLSERFDIIECQGVLHHLKDPIQGWKVLTQLLKPDGLLKIGLYSKTARRYIIEAQQFVKEQGFPLTPEGIRQARESLSRMSPEVFQEIVSLPDYYNLSMFRDLVMHSQEYNYELSEIAEILEQLQLTFIGMDAGVKQQQIYQQFEQTFPETSNLSSLDLWSQYEQKYPDTFIGMYNFWCQKKN